jgi:methylated-DNA-[protein]-cysteine S-methyltransferase
MVTVACLRRAVVVAVVGNNVRNSRIGLTQNCSSQTAQPGRGGFSQIIRREKMWTTDYSSPLGNLLLVANQQALTGVYFAQHAHFLADPAWRVQPDLPLFAVVKTQFDEYFAARRKEFDLPLQAQGTAFQQTVWKALRAIPFGQTRSYAQLATAIGNPQAVRAVASANARNPLSIIVPCHRVIGSNGKLTGYAGGLENKHFLLALEKPRAFQSDGQAHLWTNVA